jgi:hypothetical protein
MRALRNALGGPGVLWMPPGESPRTIVGPVKPVIRD